MTHGIHCFTSPSFPRPASAIGSETPVPPRSSSTTRGRIAAAATHFLSSYRTSKHGVRIALYDCQSSRCAYPSHWPVVVENGETLCGQSAGAASSKAVRGRPSREYSDDCRAVRSASVMGSWGSDESRAARCFIVVVVNERVCIRSRADSINCCTSSFKMPTELPPTSPGIGGRGP